MTRRLSPAEWQTLAQCLQQAGETRAAERLRAQLVTAAVYGVTGAIELTLPAGVAAAVERLTL